MTIDDEGVALVVDIGTGHDHSHHPRQRYDLAGARLAVDFYGGERMDYGVVPGMERALLLLLDQKTTTLIDG